MSAFLSYEGTTDYVATTPALIVSFAASGAITAGRAVVFYTSSSIGYVYQPSGQASGSVVPAGVALATVADGDPVPVLVWGYAKSLPAALSTSTFNAGQPLVITGSGYWGTSGSVDAKGSAGKIVSGSGGFIYAFIDCMRNASYSV